MLKKFREKPVPSNGSYSVKHWVPTPELRVIIGDEGQRLEQKFLDKNNETDFIWRPIDVYYENQARQDFVH